MASQSIQWATDAGQRQTQLLRAVEKLQARIELMQRMRRNRQVLPGPEKFSGKSKDWDTFLVAIRSKLQIDGDAIGDEYARFYYVYSCLSKEFKEQFWLLLDGLTKTERGIRNRYSNIWNGYSTTRIRRRRQGSTFGNWNRVRCLWPRICRCLKGLDCCGRCGHPESERGCNEKRY